MTAPKLTYAAAAMRARVATSTLQRAVAAGRLTRHTDPRDRRRVLIDREELDALYTPTLSEGAGA